MFIKWGHFSEQPEKRPSNSMGTLLYSPQETSLKKGIRDVRFGKAFGAKMATVAFAAGPLSASIARPG
jgi:hypothetical protein